MERGKLPEIPVPAWPQTATARLTNHPLSNREFLEVPYRRSHIGPPPQPDKPAASLGDYCSAVLNRRERRTKGHLSRRSRWREGPEPRGIRDAKACTGHGAGRACHRRRSGYGERADRHDYQLFLAINDIDHTKTKVKSPQTNGICERFRKTILREFHQVTFRKKIYETIEQLQNDLDEWIDHYNNERTHQGKICEGRTPCRPWRKAKPSGGKSS